MPPCSPRPSVSIISHRPERSSGRLLLLGVCLVSVLGVAPGAAARTGASFDELKQAYLVALKQKRIADMFDALEAMEIHDSADKAELLVRTGLTHGDIEIYRECEQQLRALTDPQAQKVVIDTAKKNKSVNLRADCTRILRGFANEAAFEALKTLVSDKQWLVRSESIRSLAQFRHHKTAAILIDRLKEEEGRLLDDLVDALRTLTGQSFPPVPETWMSWWEGGGKDLALPDPDAEPGTSKKKLGTAVAEGLYGQVVSDRVVFILDVSGSMTAGTDLDGSRHDIATRELERVLENQLDTDTEFNLIAFADEVLLLAPKLQKAKGKKIDKALKFVEKLRAGGETNAYGALEAAFRDKNVDTIYFLSDGSPTVGDETIPRIILMKVQEWNRYRGVKIHSIGFFPGEARNQNKEEARNFLIDLAQENRGRYTEID